MRRRRQGGGGGAILPLPFPCWFWVTLMTSLLATVDELTETWGILVEIPFSQKFSPSIFCCSTAENNVIQLFETACTRNCLEQKTLWCPHVSEWDLGAKMFLHQNTIPPWETLKVMHHVCWPAISTSIENKFNQSRNWSPHFVFIFSNQPAEHKLRSKKCKFLILFCLPISHTFKISWKSWGFIISCPRHLLQFASKFPHIHNFTREQLCEVVLHHIEG